MNRRWLSRSLLFTTLSIPLTAMQGTGQSTPPHSMTSAAHQFLSALTEAQREQILFPFGDDERTDWSYLPGRRPGIHFGEMSEEQKSAAFDFLRTTLSQQGLHKTRGVIELEGVLRELEGDHRNPDLYWFTFFGSPSEVSPWGWRLEGHHLSLNFSSVTSELIAATPAFFGANPATVTSGPKAGLRVLAAEEDLARDLVSSLDLDQKRKAIISSSAPRDIITGRDRKVRLSRFEGIPFQELQKSQQETLIRLIRLYTDNMEPVLAGQQWARISGAGLEKIWFAWAGTIVTGSPHYYRIHGPTFLIEYDNTQNNANHIHTVWRDLERDFGEDLLKEHYQNKRHE